MDLKIVILLIIIVKLCNFRLNFAQGNGENGNVTKVLYRGERSGEIPEGAASLVFVFDITGSMYDDLVQVIEGAAKILATTLSRREKPLYNYVLVPFHDPDVGPVVVTTDPDDFQYELRSLYVQGGTDCPEMSITAIKEAIDVSLPNSFIYVFTDARSKDYFLVEEVLAMIQKKQSQVVFVLTGDCGDPEHEGYIAYEQIASTSSGQVFLLKKTQVNEVLKFVRVAVQTRKVNLMSVDVKDKFVNEFKLPVDSQLQEVTISVSGPNPRISVTDPSGNKLTPARGLKKLLDIQNALVYNVKDPQPGVWRMIVEGQGRHTIRVTGLSTTDFAARFSRKPGTDLLLGDYRPVGGVPTYLKINATDLGSPGAYSQVELFDLYGMSLAVYPLARDGNSTSLYTAPPFVPPETFFYIQVSGVDQKGYILHRQTPTAITRLVPGRPTVYMPEVTKGYFGRTAVLTCTVDSLVPYSVRWFKEEVQEGPELYFQDPANSTLEIPAANQFAEGIYFCNATNAAGTVRVPTFLDISEPPPSITIPQNVSVLPGNSALLTCHVFSAVEHNLTWHGPAYKDPIRSSQKFVNFNNGSLLVRSVVRSDEGMYTCRASNEGGTTEKNAYIHVQVAPTVKINPQTASFKVGETREFTCIATGFPEPSVNWLRGGQAVITNQNVRVVANKLELRNLKRGDEGIYTCWALNAAGEVTTNAELKYIEEPHISVYESKVLVASGDEAILFCGADGIPKPEIHWYRGDVELKALSYVQITDQGQLRILGTQQLDAGQYRCEARNEAGKDEAIITLEVGSQPEVIEAPANVDVNIGSNATLHCRVDGLPAPKQFWQRADGRPLEKGNRVRHLPTGELVILNVGLEDQGSYTCVAQNQFGTVESSAFLTITGIVSPVLEVLAPELEVVAGDTVELNCRLFQGNPNPKLVWLRGERPIQEDSHFIVPQEGSVTIEDVQSVHSGEYTCHASNVGGNASFTVLLTVKVPPKFNFDNPEDEQIDFNIVEGDRVVLPCNVQGDPRPQITWFKDESPISLTDYHYFINEDGSLEIYSAEAIDTGLYRCQATNEAGEVEKIVNLFVQVPPTIAGDPNEKYIVIENETVVLPCVAKGIPLPKVAWRKNFMPFEPTDSERYLLGDHGLTITSVQVEDKAIYECIASNNGGEETKVLVLVVQVPPVILETNNTEFTVLKGDTVRLDCENSGDPRPLVEWKKDETMLALFDDISGLKLVDTGSIVIGAARIEHSGTYVCIVTNEAGIATRDFTVKVDDPPQLPNNLTTYKDVVEDNALILRCPAMGTPPPIITWYKDGTIISGDQLGVVILEDGSLQLLSAEAEDSGLYTCEASNYVGTVNHNVTVKVWVPPKLTGPDKGKEGAVDNPKVILGQNVTLTCPVEGDPDPEITWLRNGFPLSETEDMEFKYSLSYDARELTIFEVQVADTARYMCTAKNLAGETDKSFDLDVYVPPAIDTDMASPEKNVVIQDNSLYIDCPVSGVPRPKVTWYKDGELLSPELDPNLRLHADGRRLEIKEARVSDAGEYVCVGENIAGSAENKFDVDVHVPPKIDRPGEISKPEIVKNDTISLTCPAAGVPIPEITWYKNGIEIGANSSQFKLLNDGWTLEIVSAQIADSARYTCRATNAAGESEKVFDLNVLVPPYVDRALVNLFPKVVVNQSTIISCPAEGKPSPSITWLKNGLLLETSVQTRYEILSGGRQLRIKNAQLSDTAGYVCVAENKAGIHSVDFNLTVLVPPRIDTRRANANPKVVQNSTLTLTCHATGVPSPVITWFKNGDMLLSNNESFVFVDGGRELKILNTQVSDTGIYSCNAANEAGESVVSYNVQVQVPPQLDMDDINPSPHVLLGGSVVLNCPVFGVPEPEVMWMRAGLPINFDTNPFYKLEGEGHRLVITNARLSDAGLFVCVANNEAGTISQEYNLDVWVAPTIDRTNLDLVQDVIKGQPITLFCPAVGNPEPAILWLKESDPVELDGRVQILNDGLQLRISNASISDTARYTCVVRNAAGQDSVSVDLSVLVPPSIDESNVVYFRRVVQNRTIIIECPVSGIPKPKVAWLVNGKPAVESSGLRITHGGYNLEIPSAQVKDSAVYTCVASNTAGELQKKFDLEVQVPPVIDRRNLETRLSVIQNRTRVIFCPVYGIPTPSILWSHNNAPLLDWPYPRLTLTSKEQRLEVTNAQVEDAGTYTCTATNPAGQVKQDFQLEVNIPPNIVDSEYVSEISVTRGSLVTLECIATGNPEPQIAWMKGSQVIEISQNPQMRILKNGRVLQIPNSNVEDAGRYKCHAENKAGIAERLFELQVHVAPNLAGLSGVQNLWVIVNEPLTLDCPAEGVPPPSVTWSRQDQFIQPYGNPRLRLLEDGRKLMIVSSQLLDLGEYTCYVENVAGNDSLEYFVNVYVPPTIEGGYEQIQAVVNSQVTLSCETIGLPDPIVTWTKDSVNFPTTGLRHRMRPSGTIDFNSVRLEDAGDYSCLATNEAGTATRSMTLEVQVPPRILGPQSLNVESIEGKGVVLPCNFTGAPEPSISWQKGATVLRRGAGKEFLANGSLFIQQTTEADGGVYVCIAQNTAGTAFGQIRLRIFMPPTIEVRETAFVTSNGQNIVLPCRATGKPRPTVTWERNGVAISGSSSYVRVIRHGLAIPFARPEDAGTYTCVATNDAGTSSVELRLTVQVPPQIGEASRLLTFTVDETASLQCTAIGIPAPTIRWLKDGRELENSHKYNITSGGTLIIRSLKEEDTGSYLCSASNIAGQATQERLIRIQVPPSFIVVPRVQEVLLDSRLELRCTADGIPTPTIHWKRDDVLIPSQPSVNGRSLLIVQNVRPEDGGVYTCVAQNHAGEAEVSTVVNVKVPPEILTPPGNKAVTIAERVVLACSVGGDPPPKVVWLKNGRPVKLSDRIRQLNNGSLVIYDSTSSDAGEYKCVATNDVGTSEGVAMLTVREPPSFLLEPVDTRVELGANVRLDCLGVGEPVPDMQWMVGWTVLKDEGRLSILPNNSLRIVSAQLSDSGTYRCMASNNLGQTFIEVNITVIVHGLWSEWSPWEACSLSCGEGIQLRHRSCDNPEPANQGRACVGEPIESRPCLNRGCPVSGNWGIWLPWEQCSVTCGLGRRTRRRLCNNPWPQLGGAPCEGEDLQTEVCDSGHCAVAGDWGGWSQWQPCSSTCGDGIQARSRTCNSPSPSNGGRFCRGSDTESQTCKVAECAVDGQWGNWGYWAPCSLSCGGGSRSRQRLCNNPRPEYGGQTCTGSGNDTMACNSEPCPVHGGWSPWGQYGECSVSCNGGLRRRYRQCDSPSPSNDGRPCPGRSDEAETCNQVPCPVDGRWSIWSDWSQCSRTCDAGRKTRSRSCEGRQNGGLDCHGEREQIMDCFITSCYKIPILGEGSLIGSINSVEISGARLTAHMVPLSGNTATLVNVTVEGIPSELVPHFRHLLPILSPLYWSTATELDGAYNGYKLTKGEFAREVQVQYTTGEILHVSQYGKGVDTKGVLHVDLVVRGEVPEIEASRLVKMTPFWEDYTQTGPGTIHADSTSLFKVDGFVLPYAWNHSISYGSRNSRMPFLMEKLHARNIDVIVEPEKNIVQFRLEASISPGSPSNQCPTGFRLNPEGPYCQDDDECRRLQPCSHLCHNSAGSYYCSCPPGYTLDVDGRQCIDINECSTLLDPCPRGRQCVNSIGSYTCSMKCRRGMRLSDDRLRCEDIDECDVPRSPCEQVCANSPGTYVCSCRQGFELVASGRCTDVDECKVKTDACPRGQECINSVGSYKCAVRCPKGYEMVIGGCADVDECRTNQHRCYYNQKCVNTEPGYKCVCPRGYRSAGPGTPCFDIDECEETPEVCAYQCENTHGGYECLCAPGQVRLADRKSCAGLEFIDQPTIHDVSSLRANPYTLSKTLHSSSDTVNETRHSNAKPARGATTDSTSTKSAARLEVPTVAPSNGYGTEQGQGHVLQGQVVRHTDPVNGFGAEVAWIEVYEKKQKRNKKEKNKDQMEKNRKKAKRGRLTKKCTEGFVLHDGSKECLDIDECTEDPGVCQHNCTNTVGGYNCTCPPGYRISKDKRTCEDVNECIEFEINCGREKMCFNTLGEFTCIDVPCPRGYQRDPITNNCVLECIDAEIACPQSSKFADVIEFRTLALPSGVLAQQDLIRLTAYNQNNEILHRTVFTILENDVLIPFQIRLEDGIGIVYTPRVLEDSRLYKIKVQAKSFDNVKDSIQYQTTFMIHISVSAFPY